MSFGGFDPEIVQDFLTETTELLNSLEGDLVGLEKDPENSELINQVFRALHTIKGSASFLELTNLVGVAHAAESALNAARGQLISIDRSMMDLLLQAVDIIKVQIGQIQRGEPLDCAPSELISGLLVLGETKEAKAPSTSAPTAAAQSGSSSGIGRVLTPLSLPPDKAALVEFLITDVEETLGRFRDLSQRLLTSDDRRTITSELSSMAEELCKAVGFFDFAPCSSLSESLLGASQAAAELPKAQLEQLIPRTDAVCRLMSEQCTALRSNQLLSIPPGRLLENIQSVIAGEDIGSDTLAAAASFDDVMHTDEVDGRVALQAASPSQGGTLSTASLGGEHPGAANAQSTSTAGSGQKADAGAPGAKSSGSDSESAPKAVATIESTIRVEVSRLEALLNLVGELVLQKNRMSSLARRIAGDQRLEAALAETVSLAAGSLDRVTADIQAAVMRTRMQPLERLFNKYPRLIRDLCTKTGKKIHLVIEGGETEVDKSVIEELGDPLVHLLRNAADHGIESGEARVAAGKDESGTITLRANHEGSQVRVQVIDNGRGLDRKKVGAKAVERGLTTQEQLVGMSDREVFKFIFEPGFSTAETVSDLSGRGVGMDVVRTNVEGLKGSIELSSKPGQGTTVSITIPLTVAILPAMMVEIRGEVYAIPLTNIVEIVKPDESQLRTIGSRPVMRLRDSVLPLIDAGAALGCTVSNGDKAPFVVVLSNNDNRVGLMVSRLIGQQEVVIKPIDGEATQLRSLISGATVRDDGGVSLIVDVAELIREAEGELVTVSGETSA